MFCTQCGHELQEGQRFCVQCGAPVTAEPATPRCPTCGAEVPADAAFCTQCGTRLGASQQPPAPPPIPVSPQTVTPPPSSTATPKRKSGIYWAIAAAVLLVIAILALAIPRLIDIFFGQEEATTSSPLTDTPTSEEGAELSEEQRNLLQRLSAPDTFTLVMAEGEDAGAGQLVRIELWNYHILGTCFKFVDGEFRGVDEAEEVLEPTDFPHFAPEQFSQDMTIGDVNDLVGDIPQAGADVDPEIMGEAEIYVYEQGLLVAFADGHLSYVTTQSVLPTGGN